MRDCSACHAIVPTSYISGFDVNICGSRDENLVTEFRCLGMVSSLERILTPNRVSENRQRL
jgi:hypothetical protein